jgi:hypothetical protein
MGEMEASYLRSSAALTPRKALLVAIGQEAGWVLLSEEKHETCLLLPGIEPQFSFLRSHVVEIM